MSAIHPTHFERIPTFVEGKAGAAKLVHAVVETPRDTRHKYAFEPKFGAFKLKEVLPEGLEWPYDYGFIPGTLADDGDALDILNMSVVPTFTGCLIECRILGIIRLKQDGVRNDRVISAPPRRNGVAQPTDKYADADDIPKETIDGIMRFLIEYSAEEGHDIVCKGVRSRAKALESIEVTMENYRRRAKARD